MSIIYLEGDHGPDSTSPGRGTGKTTLLLRFLQGLTGRNAPSTMVVGETRGTVRDLYNDFGDKVSVQYAGVLDLLHVFEQHNNGRTAEDDQNFLQCQAGRYSNYIFDMELLPLGVDPFVFQRMVRLLARGSHVYMTFKPCPVR